MIQPIAKQSAGQRARFGVGQFAALEQVQDPAGAIAGELLASLTGSPGIRLAEPTGRRTYHGAALTIQRFQRPPSELNSIDQLRGAQVNMIARRHIGKHRGRVG